MLLRTENISKSYKGEPVIENISITLNEGETVSLLGASGIGKTTFFNILSGLDLPDSGRIYLDGSDVTGTTGKMGYMQQSDLLLPHLTIMSNVCVPLLLKKMSKKQARAVCAPLFEQFGLSGTEDKYPCQLSGGMRQRAAFLRAHLFGGRLLLLDEPFSALDTFTKNAMHEWFLKISAAGGDSSLIITHDVEEAILLSDRVYIISGKPGAITGEIKIEPLLPRGGEFLLSTQFLDYKKKILGEIV